MKITVIICSCNRCESLKDTLSSLMNQDIDHVDIEVIVVDNNSTDKTKGVVEYYISRSNRKLIYLYEQRQGKAYALNTGLRQSTGEIVAFTDDDVIVSPDWLQTINNFFINYKEIHCITGKVIPIWDIDKPVWYNERMRSVLPHIDLGEKVKPHNYVIGSNMAIRRNVFDKIGNFYPSFQCEDSYFSLRLLNVFPILYLPSLKVMHKVLPYRMTKKYFRKWYYFSGVSLASMMALYNVSNKNIFRIPVWIYINFASYCILYFRNINKSANRFYYELEIFRFFGFARRVWLGDAERLYFR